MNMNSIEDIQQEITRLYALIQQHKGSIACKIKLPEESDDDSSYFEDPNESHSVYFNDSPLDSDEELHNYLTMLLNNVNDVQAKEEISSKIVSITNALRKIKPAGDSEVSSFVYTLY